jgi:hypothetical protein
MNVLEKHFTIDALNHGIAFFHWQIEQLTTLWDLEEMTELEQKKHIRNIEQWKRRKEALENLKKKIEKEEQQ